MMVWKDLQGEMILGFVLEQLHHQASLQLSGPLEANTFTEMRKYTTPSATARPKSENCIISFHRPDSWVSL